MKIVLASASPRRRELLENIGLEFTVRPSSAEESADKSLAPQEYVKACSALKAAAAAAEAAEDELVITADTMVFKAGELLGKPKDRDDARRMLGLLSGTFHEVYTAVSISYKGKTVCEAEKTRVFFKELSEEEKERYVDSGEPMDKAGAYGIQILGGLFVKKIDGDYFNVVGLPLHRLSVMLKKHFDTDIMDLCRNGKKK